MKPETRCSPAPFLLCLPALCHRPLVVLLRHSCTYIDRIGMSATDFKWLSLCLKYKRHTCMHFNIVDIPDSFPKCTPTWRCSCRCSPGMPPSSSSGRGSLKWTYSGPSRPSSPTQMAPSSSCSGSTWCVWIFNTGTICGCYNRMVSGTRPVSEQTHRQCCSCPFQESTFSGKFRMANGKLTGSVELDK